MMESTVELKKVGNRLYQGQNFEDAVSVYSEALEKCTDVNEKSILLKNRAAAYLKLGNFDLALSDCDSALQISPMDIKTLYRRSQALEATGHLSEAFQAIKTALTIDSTNKEVLASARRLSEVIRRRSDIQHSTSEKVKDMFDALLCDKEKSLKIQAARNFAIMSRDSSGYRQLLAADGDLSKLTKMLESPLDEVVHHVLQTFIGLCGSAPSIILDLVQTISIEKLNELVKHPHTDVSSSTVTLLKTILLSANETCLGTNELVVTIIRMMLTILLSSDVYAFARDAVLKAITITLQQVHVHVSYIII